MTARACRFCRHDEPGDLRWCGDFWACSDFVWCDFRAVDRDLWRGEHLEGSWPV